MKYSPSIDIIMSLAGNEAQAGQFQEIQPEHLLMALLKFSEFNLNKIPHVLMSGINSDFLRSEIEELQRFLIELRLEAGPVRRLLRLTMGKGGHPSPPGSRLHRSRHSKEIFLQAESAATADQAEQVTPVHLLRPLLENPTSLIAFLLYRLKEDQEKKAAAKKELVPPKPGKKKLPVPAVGELTQTLKELRNRILEKIFGQDHAVQSFVEGLFNAEVVAAADTKRKRPKALFVFAGPPGVGKTYLAESGAEALERAFKRFDMSGYSDHQISVDLLTGVQRSYKGAKQGQLTEFVLQHPEAILLFDEIEKAHLNVIHLFLQILDNGTLEDKFTEENIVFKDTIIIFTTNAGRALYDNPNTSGFQAASSTLHRKTILNALEKEIDSRTRQPFFPQALCSRLATGYPLMFNRLGVNELEQIARQELGRLGGLLQEQYNKKIDFGPAVPLCLVMREGVRTDARTVRSQAELFVKSELFKFFSLYKPERLASILADAGKIVFDLDADEELSDDLRGLMEPTRQAKVLLAARPRVGYLWSNILPEFDWKIALDLAEAQNLLGMYEFDLVLLDLWLGSADVAAGSNPQGQKTVDLFDHLPLTARSLHAGQELLRLLRDKYPEAPCYLLDIKETEDDLPEVDEEVLLACIRSGGARGVLATTGPAILKQDKTAFQELLLQLQEMTKRIFRERQAGELGSQNKAISFDTAPLVSPEHGDIVIRLRNLRTVQAVEADDTAALLQDAERPTIRFADVYGAAQAKGELQHIVKWLKNPRQFQAMGLRPPRGILLYGPPGTGKTMLARALAGECNATFITESAANFVTKWLGSGPENIRQLFARARRYAPSIIFIDEIDAIGRKRSGEAHHRHHEETLNSLLTEMDGFGSPASRPVVVLAATNLVESLDAALRRRFDRDIEVDKPDRASRAAFLKLRLQGSATRRVSDQVLERLSGQSANMTIAELERVIQLAGRQAALSDGIITDALIEEAFETMRMGEAKGGTSDPETLRRVARHEAGHCLIGWLQGIKPVQVTIVARGQAGGYVEREAEENRMLYTKSELEGKIRQCMGGRAAELIYYGKEDGLSSGVGNDLKQATHLAELMARDYGMSPEVGQVAVDKKHSGDGPLALLINQAVSTIVRTQLERAEKELQFHQQALNLLVEQLMDKNRLTKEELEKILAGIEG